VKAINKIFRSFIFPLFTLTSAGLVIVVWWIPNLLPWMVSPWLGGMGIVAILVALWVGWKRLLSSRLVYDLLLWGSLWCWLFYWLPLFGPEAPLFKAYPIYFVVMDVFVGNIISWDKQRMSAEEHRLLSLLASQWWFNGKLLAGVVLLGLVIIEHYLIYPLAVGLLVIRRALEQVLSPY